MPRPNTSFLLVSSSRRKEREEAQDRGCVFSGAFITDYNVPDPMLVCTFQTLSCFILTVSLQGRTTELFCWGTLRLRRGLENCEIWNHGWLPDSKALKHYTVLLLSWKKQMCSRQMLRRSPFLDGGDSSVETTEGRGPLAEFCSFGAAKVRRHKRKSHHVESCLFCYLLWQSLQKIFWVWSICFFIRFILSNC